MGINVGALIAPLVVGLITGNKHPELYFWVFILSGITMIGGIILFITTKNKYLRDPQNRPIGNKPSSEFSEDLSEEECDESILNRREYNNEEEFKKEKEKLKNYLLKKKRYFTK